MRPVLRRPDPVALARRVVVGIGLRDVRVLEARVEQVGEELAENALLAKPLEDHVRRLERSLVPLLEARGRAIGRAGATSARGAERGGVGGDAVLPDAARDAEPHG